MRRALEYVKAFDGVVAQHAQEPRLTEDAQMNEGELSGVLGLTGWPAVAEEAIIARDVLLAGHVGSRLHVCHVSTAGSVEIIRWAKAKGVDVTAEVTPHHLLLTDDAGRDLRPGLQGQPAAAHRRRRRGAAARRSPTARSTRSPPTTRRTPLEDKDRVVGGRLRHARARDRAVGRAVETMVETGLLDWAGVADRMSVRAGAGSAGSAATASRSRVGAPANLVLVDPTRRWTVEPAELASPQPQHAVRRAHAAGPGRRDVPARPADRARTERAA